MKVHINSDGTVELDVVDGESHAAIELIDALQARRRESIQLADDVRESRAGETVNLTAALYRTWEFLVNNDCPSGVHISAVARAFAITDASASSRLKDLLKQGNAKRIRRGYYRATSDGKGEK
jgi:hypothetical protein